jgi:hypothetical protein
MVLSKIEYLLESENELLLQNDVTKYISFVSITSMPGSKNIKLPFAFSVQLIYEKRALYFLCKMGVNLLSRIMKKYE